MLDMAWSSDTTKDPLILADAIELAVAFAKDDYNSRFTRADFQHRGQRNPKRRRDVISHWGPSLTSALSNLNRLTPLSGNRASWLGVAYPFSVSTNESFLTARPAIELCLPYLFLLVTAPTCNCVPSLKSALSDQFEDLCKLGFPLTVGRLGNQVMKMISVERLRTERNISGGRREMRFPIDSQRCSMPS